MSGGFTWVETLVVLALMALLTAGGLPPLRGLLARRMLEAEGATLMASFRLARAEAVKSGWRVSVCQSESGEQCGRGAEARDWSRGWIVFVDGGTRGQVDPGDRIVLRQPRMAPGAAIVSTSTASSPYVLSLLPTGIATAAQNGFRLQAASSTTQDDAARILCVSSAGQARIAAGGTC